MISEIIMNLAEYCCFIRKAFPRFDFSGDWQHSFSSPLVQVTMNAPLVRVKLLRAVNQNPDSYSYSYSCLCERGFTLRGGSTYRRLACGGTFRL